MPEERVEQNLVLELRDVYAEPHPPYDSGLYGCSFSLMRGEQVGVCVRKGVGHSPLVPIVLGLEEPARGQVLFMGRPWQDRSPQELARARGRIGRVFAEDGWISNLDVDENILLPQCHHTYRPVSEILKEAEELARRFGVNSIPSGRPMTVKRPVLRVLEWVRALIGEKWLLILEYPMRGVAPDLLEPLIEIAAERRTRGMAVLWLTDDEREWEVVGPLCQKAYELGDSFWKPIEKRGSS